LVFVSSTKIRTFFVIFVVVANFASFPPSALSLHFISLSISLLLSSIRSGAFANAYESGIASYKIPVTVMDAPCRETRI